VKREDVRLPKRCRMSVVSTRCNIKEKERKPKDVGSEVLASVGMNNSIL
jgi:hypothetical protein